MEPKSNLLSLLGVIAEAIGSILIPLVIFVVGNRIARQRDKADAEQRRLAQITSLSESLASENRKRRLIALQILSRLKMSNDLPDELLTTVGAIAFIDDPEVAGAATVLLGGTNEIPESVVLLELLAPINVHFERTRRAFIGWTGLNEPLEDEIMRSNKFVRDYLVSRWHLIPDDLKEDAQALISHYDAWFAEYDRVRPGGVRDATVPFVFVGPKGKPFPTKSEKRFKERYEEFLAKYAQR